MLSFCLGKTRIIFDFSFFAVICVVSMLKGTEVILLGLFACILHELGHVFVMSLYKAYPEKIRFYCAGIKIASSRFALCKTKELLIHSAGIIINLIMFFTMYYLSDIYEVRLFGVINLLIGMFNLIPFRQFDGGKIMDILIMSDISERRLIIRNVIRAIAIALIALTGIYFYIKGKGNISLYVSIIYVIFSEVFL